jgi:hypothetical protein
MKLPEMRVIGAAASEIPRPLFPEMTLRCAGLGPPIVLPEELTM